MNESKKAKQSTKINEGEFKETAGRLCVYLNIEMGIALSKLCHLTPNEDLLDTAILNFHLNALQKILFKILEQNPKLYEEVTKELKEQLNKKLH